MTRYTITFAIPEVVSAQAALEAVGESAADIKAALGVPSMILEWSDTRLIIEAEIQPLPFRATVAGLLPFRADITWRTGAAYYQGMCADIGEALRDNGLERISEPFMAMLEALDITAHSNDGDQEITDGWHETATEKYRAVFNRYKG